MRLEIGPDGKIIGTRRVSPNGQVSGLTEYSGREVLVILPGASYTEATPSWGSPEAISQAVEEQVREAYHRYDLLQKLYATPWEATRSFVRSAFGPSAPDVVAEVDRWVKEQLKSARPGATAPGPSPSRSEAARKPAHPEATKKRSGKHSDAT
jgi:hypothetical protein